MMCILTQVDFGIIWRYFAWSNQTLATVVLWAITAYLTYTKKFYWITLIPAFFMTMVCSTYILIAPEGFELDNTISYVLGGIITLIVCVLFMTLIVRKQKVHPITETENIV